ncbi:unnamed protein product [Linum tenue]|uniref:U1-type domain-containing protein n=1 Tax=Linum tenue TaxID=586396 RepID=A0AAV0S029_9ROSI|nr:unnamed protein product [Linum tenue]
MRIRLTVPENTSSSLVEKLNAWEATITARDSSGSQLSFVCEIEPGFFRDCDILVRNLQGRMEILAVSVHFEGDTHVDDIADHVDLQPSLPTKGSADPIAQLSEKIQKQTISSAAPKKVEAKQNQCSTCSAVVGDAKEYREHFKSDWHKHNLKRKTRNLPPLTADECSADVNLGDSKSDLKDYSF